MAIRAATCQAQPQAPEIGVSQPLLQEVGDDLDPHSRLVEAIEQQVQQTRALRPLVKCIGLEDPPAQQFLLASRTEVHEQQPILIRQTPTQSVALGGQRGRLAQTRLAQENQASHLAQVRQRSRHRDPFPFEAPFGISEEPTICKRDWAFGRNPEAGCSIAHRLTLQGIGSIGIEVSTPTPPVKVRVIPDLYGRQ